MAAKKPKNPKKTSSGIKPKKPGKPYEQPESDNRAEEPAVEYTTRVRAIGNSNGVILNNHLMDFAGLDAGQDIVIRAVDGVITIRQVEKPVINTDLSTWEKQIKAAIKAGDIPEGDMWNGIENQFDLTEW